MNQSHLKLLGPILRNISWTLLNDIDAKYCMCIIKDIAAVFPVNKAIFQLKKTIIYRIC